MKDLIFFSIRVLIGLTFAIFVVGCSVYGTDRTDLQDRGVGGMVVQALHSQQLYFVRVEISRDFFVISNSINVKALVDGTSYPLSGYGEGIWYGGVPAACKLSPLNYSYQIDWKYLALIIPISDSKTIPAEGEFQGQFIMARPFQAPDELHLYGESPISKVVEIKALYPLGVTVYEVSISPPPPGTCWIGDCTGQNFSLSNLPTLPYTLSCGSSTQFNVDFASSVESSGVLIVSTDEGIKEIPLSGKIFP